MAGLSLYFTPAASDSDDSFSVTETLMSSGTVRSSSRGSSTGVATDRPMLDDVTLEDVKSVSVDLDPVEEEPEADEG